MNAADVEPDSSNALNTVRSLGAASSVARKWESST